MFFPTLRFQDKHKFVIQLKKFLNELVQPSPNLPLDDVVDDKTIKAVYNFKNQWLNRVTTSQYDSDHRYEITPGLWAMIGRALGKDKLLKELKEVKDNEIRSLLLGMEATNNLSAYYSAEMEICDAKIAAVLGGKNAIAAANGFEPDSLAIVRASFTRQYPYYRGDTIQNGKAEIGHLSAYIMHLYGSADGARFGVDGKTYTDVYVPDGFEMKKGVLTQTPTPTQEVVTFYYKKLGKVEDATLLMMHIKDFKPRKEGNRWRIGKIGGIGGQIGDITSPYLHSHFALLRGDVGIAVKTNKYGKMDSDATNEYREKIGIRFVDAFC